jgi:ribonuclease HI
LLRAGEHERELKGGEQLTTNNRMELTAAIKVLQSLKRPCTVDLYTDSQYVRGGITTWMAGWKKNGWRTSGRQPVKNQDLWEALDLAAARHEIRWHWVKGHSGHPENDRADALANQAIDDLLAGFGGSDRDNLLKDIDKT